MRPRVVIAGGPRCGKTTLSIALAEVLGITPLHTDDLMASLDWSAASAECARWLRVLPGPLCIEGVATVRALRKALSGTSRRPCDILVVLTEPKIPTTPGQQRMALGVQTVLHAIHPELLARGVEIVDGEAALAAIARASEAAQ